MKFILALLVLTIIALAGSRRVLFARSVPLGARLVFLTGTEFIVVGLLLGEPYLNLIDRETLAGLEPFIAVCLGWVGLLFGLQFEHRSLKTLPSTFFTVTMIQGIFTLAVVFFVFFLVLGYQKGNFGREIVLAATALGAAAACTGQPALAMIQRRFPGKNRQLLSLLRYIASLDPLPAVVALGVVTCMFIEPGGAFRDFGGGSMLLLGVSFSCLIGWMVVSLGWGRTSRPELLLVVAGTCAICGGMAIQLHISTLFLSMICGIIVANISRLRVRMTELLAGGEKFIYMILLILAGAGWQIPSVWILAFAAFYVVTRLVAKSVGAYVATRSLARRIYIPAWVGLGLTAQAGMALAIVIDFHYALHGPMGNIVLTIVIVGIIVSELIGPALAMTVVSGRSEPSGETT